MDRPGLVAGAGAGIAAYAWVASGLESFTGPAYAAAVVPGLALLVLAARTPDRPARLDRSVVTGTGVAVAVGAWQLAQYLSAPRDEHPTLSSMADELLEARPLRAAVVVAWLLIGWRLARPATT
ncbi:MAG: hypothetical protein ACRD0G_20895 [Acidimicrobiales bacterium]